MKNNKNYIASFLMCLSTSVLYFIGNDFDAFATALKMDINVGIYLIIAYLFD